MAQGLNYWLSEHPSIVNFRWSHAHSWGSTWSFLLSSIAVYVGSAVFLHFVLSVFRRRRPVPLGIFPALHSLCLSLSSAVVFVGILLSASAEIRDTRWFWRRTRTTPIQWLLCFPLGTRPSGRVFFWSYVFYLSRFLHLLRTFFAVLRRRRLSLFQILNQSVLLCMSFLWLEYSQSFQVVAILLATLLYAVVYGYRFWTAVGLPSACFPFVLNCQVALLGCNLVCHVAVLMVHLMKGGGGGGGGCNGIGAWGFNSVLNATILLLFLKFYLTHYKNSKVSDSSGADKAS